MANEGLERSPSSDTRDRGRCIERALSAAQEICRMRKARLTPMRQQVLILILHRHKPIGAYTLMEKLRAQGVRATPPTVYRALEFLLTQGFIHRVESLNAYLACLDPGQSHQGQYLICQGCGLAEEVTDPRIPCLLDRLAAAQGFRIERQMVELVGYCRQCNSEAFS